MLVASIASYVTRWDTPRAACKRAAVFVGISISDEITRAPSSAIHKDKPPFRLPSSKAEQAPISFVVYVDQNFRAADQLRTSHSTKTARSDLARGIPFIFPS